jgi:hypothetical protein
VSYRGSAASGEWFAYPVDTSAGHEIENEIPTAVSLRSPLLGFHQDFDASLSSRIVVSSPVWVAAKAHGDVAVALI